MKPIYRKLIFWSGLGLMVVILVLARGSAVTSSSVISTPAVTPTSIWAALMERVPFDYLTPLPPAVQSPLDGTYGKIDQSPPQWWKCLRCADYRVSGGIWKLQFDDGVMRIFYDVTGWRSIASFTVSEDRLQVFNDPYCPEIVGEYRWHLIDGELQLDLIEDSCAFDLRAKNLTKQPWPACISTAGNNSSAERSEPACLDTPIVPVVSNPSNATVDVIVYGGDSRFFVKPPDVTAIANTVDGRPPDGIEIDYHPGTIGYGIHRVLWWNGDWIETSTDLSFKFMGVQILGESVIGWARVLFDGVEVWRGNTAQIWSKSGRHGGYIEISGYEPGRHTIRVESLNFDYHPVTIAGFGFRYEGGVQVEEP